VGTKLFNYTAPPVLSQFHMSNSRVRAVRGPVGPLSAETEFFTGKGWKRIDKYVPGDNVASVDMSDPRAPQLIIKPPIGYIVTPADRMLYARNAHSVSMVVSPCHRVPHFSHSGEFLTKPAREVVNTTSKKELPIHFSPNTKGIILSDDMIRFAVMVHADGSFSELLGRRGKQCVVTVRKDRKKGRLEALLGRLGVEFSIYKNANRPTEIRYTFYPPYVGKMFSGGALDFYQCSQSQLRVIIDEMSHWDGLWNHAETRFYTTLKQDADFMQYAAHAVGRRATINATEYPDNPAWATTYSVQIANADSPKNKVTLRSLEVTEVPTTDGKQYCFTTEETYFLARHNGKVFITGNSGKSTAMVMELLRKAQEQEPGPDGIRRTRMVIVRNTLSQLKTTCLETIMGIMRPICTFKVSESTVKVRFNDVESDWILMPLDTPQNVNRLLSLELTFGWISEHREIDPQIAMDVYSRLGRFPSKINGGCTDYGLIMETNSFSEDSPWNAKLELELPTNWSYHVQPSGLCEFAENVENLPDDYYKDMLASNSDVWCEQYIENKITPSLSGQAVFRSTFREDFHVIDAQIPLTVGYPLIIGMDFARHPAAAIGQLDHLGRLKIFQELDQENMGVEKFVNEFLSPMLATERFRGHSVFIVGDPSGIARGEIGEESVFMMLKRLGYQALPASTNYITPRIRSVEKYLLQQRDGGPAMLIDREGCPQIIQAFKSKYKYKKKKDGQLEEKPDKSRPWADVMDAVQYLSLGTGANMMGRIMRPARAHVPSPPVRGWT